MISDVAIKKGIDAQWTTIAFLSQGSHRQSFAGDVYINETPPEEIYDLAFVLAYSALDQVLSQLAEQKLFECTRWELGAKMSASRATLPWKNYPLVDEGKSARNALAHEGKLLRKHDCLRYIHAVEDELRAWAILT